MSAEKHRYRPATHLAFREIDGAMVLVHPIENRVITLNETGTEVFKRLDGRTVSEIAQELERLYHVGFEGLLRDTLAFLEQLEQRRLVQREESG